MSLFRKGADMKAERVCYPQIRIDDWTDSSTQPSGGIAYKLSE
jgi:hypothetical protein